MQHLVHIVPVPMDVLSEAWCNSNQQPRRQRSHAPLRRRRRNGQWGNPSEFAPSREATAPLTVDVCNLTEQQSLAAPAVGSGPSPQVTSRPAVGDPRDGRVVWRFLPVVYRPSGATPLALVGGNHARHGCGGGL